MSKPVFYGTFMQKQVFKNHYCKIRAKDEAAARAFMFAHFAEKFFTVYSEDEFNKSRSKHGLQLQLLIDVDVTDNGFDKHYFDAVKVDEQNKHAELVRDTLQEFEDMHAPVTGRQYAEFMEELSKEAAYRAMSMRGQYDTEHAA